MLELTDGRSSAERIQPAEIQAGTEVSTGSRQKNDAGLTGLLNLLNLEREGAGELRSQCVAARGAIQDQPVDGPIGQRRQLGHASLVFGTFMPSFYPAKQFRVVLYEEARVHT